MGSINLLWRRLSLLRYGRFELLQLPDIKYIATVKDINGFPIIIGKNSP